MPKKKETRGRKTVFTEEVLRKIEEVAALDGSVAEMAMYSGIHPDSIYARMKENKEFSDRIASLRERPVLKARQTVIKNLDTLTGATWYLGKKKRKEFGDQVQVEGEIRLKVDF